MNRKLVAYFSPTGTTAQVARTLAAAVGADVFEIVPQTPYSPADLDWMDDHSRSTLEMKDAASRPAIAAKLDGIADYDTVFVGFPIWWYVAPTIINTFLESYDFSGKTVITFATSGTSGMGETLKKLAPSCPGARLVEGIVLHSGAASRAQLSAWVEGLE